MQNVLVHVCLCSLSPFGQGRQGLNFRLLQGPNAVLTIKVPITTAADDILKFFFFFLIFQRKLIFHVNRLLKIKENKS